MRFIVHFSTGLSSFEAARRTIEKHGAENTTVVFADVKGDPARDVHAAPAGTNWDGEDEDNYRFLADAERLLGVPIVRLQHPDGLGVWGIIFRERAISIRGVNTFAPCTKILKMEALDEFVAAFAGPITQVVGLGPSEMNRVERFRERAPNSWFPLLDAPHVDNCHIDAWLSAHGVDAPKAYQDGYSHANCGGACIKAGQQQWAHLWKDNPGRYLYNEDQEEWFRRDINPNVSILRDRSGGTTKPLPLREFRLRLESGWRGYDRTPWGGCACFAPARGQQVLELTTV